MLKKLSLYLLIATFTALALPAEANIVRSANTEVELVPEVSSIRPGQPFWIALRMQMDEHWHTYWKYPGDSGLATSIQWDLPDGFSASEIFWPYPKRMDESGLTTYAYEGEVYLLTRISVPDDLSEGRKIPIRAEVNYLACEKVCIPGEADLVYTLNVSSSGGVWNEKVTTARERLPIKDGAWSVSASAKNEDIHLRITKPNISLPVLGEIIFFPDSGLMIEHSAEQVLTKEDNAYILRIKKSSFTNELPEKLSGVLVSQYGWRGTGSERAMTVDAPVKHGVALPVKERKIVSDINIIAALIFAFVGGLILNLMPCVLPVLSLKVLKLIEHHDDPSLAWKNGVAFSAGVLLSFWVLAGLLLILRVGGAEIGWGFQFQSPEFIVFLSALFFVFALNLFGVFEVGVSLVGVDGKFASSAKGLKGSLFTGVLATVAATPCTAPFMGSALGFALTQPASVAILIFTSLGLGMASPYLVLARFPGLLKFLPKPGRWMINLKKFMGLLLLATVGWLIWVFQILLHPAGTVMLVVGLLIIGIGCVVYGRSPGSPNKSKLRVISLLCLVVGISIGLLGTVITVVPQERHGEKYSSGLDWLNFSPELVERLRAEGRNVFIDFTAAWCLSCQVNEKVVLNNPQVVDKFRELGIVAVKADWTKRDDMITRALAGYGKSSIPLYVYYRAGAAQPEILPEIITPAIVLEIIGTRE